MGSYVPTTAAEREQMLAQVGVKSLNDLYAAVPQEMFLHDGLNLPEGLSELEVREKVTGLAEKNKVLRPSFAVQAATATSSPLLSNPLPRARSLSPATPPIRRKSARAFCRARLNSRP